MHHYAKLINLFTNWSRHCVTSMLEDAGITKKIIKALRKCVKIFTQNPEIVKCPELNFLHDWIVQHVVETGFDSQALSGVQKKICPNEMQVTVEVTSSDDLCEIQQDNTTNQIPPTVWECSSFDRICNLDSSQTNTEKHLDQRKEVLIKSHNENDMLTGKTCDYADSEEPKTKLAKLSVEKCGNKSSKKMNLAKPFQCRICLKDFKSISGLDIHVNQHTEQRKFECSYCGKHYLNISGLKYHLKICTKTKKKESLLANNEQAHQNFLIDSVKLTKKHFIKCGLPFPSYQSLDLHSLEDSENEAEELNNTKKNEFAVYDKDTNTYSLPCYHKCTDAFKRRCSEKGFCSKQKSPNHKEQYKNKPFGCKVCEISFCDAKMLKSHYASCNNCS
ncbi:uncharacterized protein LOC144751861 [Ciona intestinalis]